MWNFNISNENPAIIEQSGATISYEELKSLTEEIASAVGHRCLVFSLCSNTIGSIAGYLAFINHRIVPALLNAHLDNELLMGLLSNYSPEYVWAPSAVAESIVGDVVFEKYNYSLLKTNYQNNPELYDELALLLTTSGSTGSPKFVRQSYANILSNAEAIVKYLELSASERAITTLPMNYTYGLSIINSHMLVGATILATDASVVQKEFWDMFKEHGATSIAGVPYTYEMLDRFRFYRMKLPTLRYMTQAGGKLAPELHKKFAEYANENNRKFIVMYGQCEATARMGYLPAEKSLEKYGSMGIAIPGGKFTLIDVNGKVISTPETTGELVYEGSNVTLGYAECGTDLAKGDERNGVLQTGDMAKFDRDGYYYIVGRKKRFLKIYGNRVNLDEVDRLIKAKFDYIDCASSGQDDHMVIFITNERLVEDVHNYIAEVTKLNHVAFTVKVIDEIPKNDSGKTLYRELEKYI